MQTHQSTSTQDEVFKSNPGTGITEARTPSNTELSEKACESAIKVKERVSKRIPCEKCDKKFNKKETFNAHMMKIHKQNPAGMGPAIQSSDKTGDIKENPPSFNLMTKMTLRSRDLPTKQDSNAPVIHIDKE